MKTTIFYARLLSSTLAVAGPALPAVPLVDSSTTNPALDIRTVSPEQAVHSLEGTCWEYAWVKSEVSWGVIKPSVKALSAKTACTKEVSLEYLQRMEADGVVLRDATTGWARK